MKKLYTFLGIIIVYFGVLSGCKTLFDVVPSKAVYSPIKLNNVNVGPSRDINKQQSSNSVSVSFSETDSSLRYGTLAFYDSSEAVAFVRERKIIGLVQPVPLVRSKITNTVSTTIGYDNTKGQYLYITPFAYKLENKEDSIAIYTKQDYRKVFSARGFIQLKISPWTHVTDLPGPKYNYSHNSLYLPVIFPANNKLFCITYGIGASQDVYGYEFDTTKATWVGKGSFKNNLAINNRYISRIENAYLFKNEYRLFVSTERIVSSNTESNYDAGEVVLNSDFTFKSLENIFPGYHMMTDVQGNRVVALKNLFGGGNITKGYLATLSTSTSTNIILPYDRSTEDIETNITGTNPSFVISNRLGTKLVAGKNLSPNEFNVYNLDDASLKKIPTATLSLSGRNAAIWVGGRTLAVSQGDHAFVVNSLLNIYRVELRDYSTPANQPFFSNIYSGWFPATSPSDFLRGLAFGDSVWFVVNRYELWKINLNKLNSGPLIIDFTQPGTVTPISL